MQIEEIIQRLIDGNNRFMADKPDGKLQDSKRREQLHNGQAPYAVVLGCADSRVIPELIFDTGLGEIFSVRVAGNIANTSSIASIEYAIAQLYSKVIIVMGHENCGAVAAAVAGGENGDNINYLLSHITPAKELLQGADITQIIKKNVELNAAELLSKSSIISDALGAGRIKIIPAYYHIVSGKVEFL